MTQESLFPMPQTARTSDDYWTPRWLFDAMGIEFDLDVACPPEGPPHTPAKAFYTQETDGLASPWWGIVWMNPPYSQCTPWVNKWLQHGNGLALVPFAKSKWFDRLWFESDLLLALPYDFVFDGDQRGSIMLPACLAAMGDKCVEALEQSGLGRVR